MKLTHQQEKFAQGVVSGLSQSDAYRAAYPSCAKWQANSVHIAASALANKVSIRINELRDMAASAAMMTKADVLKEAMKMARFDPRKLLNDDGTPKGIHELDDDTAAAIQSVDIQMGDGVPSVRRYKIADKNAALEKLFKHFGLYEVDNKQRTDPLAEFIASLSGNVIGPK